MIGLGQACVGFLLLFNKPGQKASNTNATILVLLMVVDRTSLMPTRWKGIRRKKR